MSFPPSHYLSKIKPFSFLSGKEIELLLDDMEVSFYKAGKTIFKKGKKINRLYFVREGKIGLISDKDLIEVVFEDELFGIEASLNGLPTEYTAKALEDSVCFELKADRVKNLISRNERFGEFFRKILSRKFYSLLKLYDENRVDDLYADSVINLARKSPVVIASHKSIRDAVRLMNLHKVGSVVVVDDGMRPLGIITHSDIVRFVNENISFDLAVKEVMSSPVEAVDSEASLMDAYLKFVSKAINHLPVVEDGRVVGLISSKDLISKIESHSSLLPLSKKVMRCKDIEELEGIFSEIKISIINMIESGFDYSSISTVVTSLVDMILKKIAEFRGIERKEISKNFVFTPIADFGRREPSFPIKLRFFVLVKDDLQPLLNEFYEDVRRVGIELEVNLCYGGEVDSFLRSCVNTSNALDFLDSRYLLGDGALYVRFREAVNSYLSNDLAILSLRKLLSELELSEYGNSVESLTSFVSDCAKSLSILLGDKTSRPTPERIKLLSGVIIPKNLAEDLREAYLALKKIELKIKLTGKDKFDDLVVKKSSGVIREMGQWVETNFLK
ncbi:MAG: CBS domain-containing protein [Archaeoglobus sp.]|nr:CBS domain-containing protein [Archaeoglobus sp.]